jgi:hypothetical protein
VDAAFKAEEVVMGTAMDELGGGTVAEQPYAWRLEQLRRAGYAGERARELAGRGDVDLHAACDLLARGCPEDVAFAILS